MKNIKSSDFLNLLKSNLNLLFKIGGISLLAATSQTLFTPSAFAGTSLTVKETFEGKVNYAVTGGTLRSASNTTNACSLNATSTAQLSNIPATATIRKAYLYWAGSGTTVDNQVKLDATSLTADRTYTDYFSLTDTSDFQGVKDVTSIVSSKRNGSYQFSNLTVDTSSKYCSVEGVLSGWSLVVVYDDPAIANNRLNTLQLYEGFQISRNQSVNYTLSGIKVATNPVAKFSMLLWEGDETLGGTNEFFKFNNNLLTDTYNPANNQFNSSINTLSSTTVYGVDLDTFNVSSYVTPGSTSVTGTVSTNNDLVIQGAALMMVTDELAVAPPPPPAANRAPDAINDTTTTPYGSPVTIDVLANDVDPDGDSITITGVSSSTGATVQIVNGKVVYTPKPHTNRTVGISDTFTYTITDSKGATDSATVTVGVGPQPNQLPVAQNDQISTAFNSPVNIPVLSNDTDPDNDPITINSVNSTTGATVQIVNDNGTQKVRYTPPSGLNKKQGGTDSFTYTIKDDQGGTSTATVNVTVNRQPNGTPIANNDTANIPYGAAVTIPVLDNDSDPDGDSITITNVTSNTGATVQIINGQVQYTPRANFNRAGGTDTFTYTIKDIEGATSTATVNVSINAKPNGAPIAVNDTANTPYGAAVTIPVLGNDSDPDGDSITITGVTSSTGANVQIVNGQVQYTPRANFNRAGGTDTFTYTIQDSQGATSSATVTVTVGIRPNVAPTAVNDTASTAYGTAIPIPVLGNDSDPDGDSLTITDVTSNTGATVQIVNGQVEYTPKSGFNKAGGTDTFTYTIKDSQGATSSASVAVTVGKKPNGAPTAMNDTANTPYGTAVTIPVLANDTDPDGDTITITDVTSSTGANVQIVNGQVKYTPSSNFNRAGGTDTFTYTIQDEDGHTSSASVTVTVGTKANGAPTAVNDTAKTPYGTAVTIPVLDNDTDPDGDPLTITGVTSSTGATVQIVNGEVKYTPKSDFNKKGGTDTFTYTIKDSQGATSSASVKVSVGVKANGTPTAMNDTASTAYGTAVTIPVLDNDSDPDGDTITITDVTSSTGATVEIVNGQVQYTPNPNFNRAGGTDTFTYTIQDEDNHTSSASVTVNVGVRANGAPTAVNDTANTPYGTAVAIHVLGNDSDPDGDTLTITDVTSSSGANVQIVNGEVQYTPKSDFNKKGGTDSFTYTIQDSQGATSSASVTVTVDPKVNGAPTAGDDTANTAYGAAITVPVLDNDSDPDGDTITITGVTSSTGATVEIVDGKVKYTPKSDFDKKGGTDTFTYTIQDEDGHESSAFVTVTVGKKPNGAPTAVNDTASTTYGTAVTIPVLDNDSDPDGDPITIDSVNSSTGATVEIVDGKVKYTPKPGFDQNGGTDTFTYTIKDEDGHTSSASVTVSVGSKLVSPEEEGDRISD